MVALLAGVTWYGEAAGTAPASPKEVASWPGVGVTP